MRFFLVILLSFLYSGCLGLLPIDGCLDYYTNNKGRTPDPVPDTHRHFHIVNHTDNTYTKNAMYSLCNFKTAKRGGKWELIYLSRVDYDKMLFLKIKVIQSNKTTHRLENGKPIALARASCYCGYDGNNRRGEDEYLFLLSLNSGKRKIFFGIYDYDSKEVYKRNEKDCTNDFVKWDVHPVFQQKDIYIHIYEDKIVFKPDAIKAVVKLKLTETEQVDPNTLPLVDLKSCNE